MVKWEYEFIGFHRDSFGTWTSDCLELLDTVYDSLPEALAAVGCLGWEMCGNSPYSDNCVWTFKRPMFQD